MNLQRQLLLVSVLTLMLPWAGCEIIRQTETALRTGQQQMMAGAALAVANSMSQYSEEFPPRSGGFATGDQIYLHPLQSHPTIDGYFDDWPLERESLRTLRGKDGPIRFAIGTYEQTVYLYVEVRDQQVIYADAQVFVLDDGSRHADRVLLKSSNPPYLEDEFAFAAEAPGAILSHRKDEYGFAPEPAITAYWQDVPGDKGGYQLEARIPESMVGTHLGLVIGNTDAA